MALYEIPTGILLEEIVETLPETGEENKVYRRLVEEEWMREQQITDDFIWYDGEWHPFSFDAKIFGAFFERYQHSVQQTIANLEQRVEELEGKGKVLFEGSNIELTEAGATIGKRIAVATNIEVTNGTVFHCTLTDMTIDGQAIPDASGDITAYQVPDWDWQGGELYDVEFGNGAYFAFGTEPKDAVADTVTLGFVNEGDGFPVRNLSIGHLKVEVVEVSPKKGGKK